MSQAARSYVFPRFSDPSAAQAPAAAPSPTPVEIDVAIKEGFETGLTRARAVAQEELAALADKARQSGYDDGQRLGLERADEVIAALTQAADELRADHDRARGQAERFCVDLALGIVARLIETDPARTKFVVRMAALAKAALAPERALKIRLNPADIAALRRRLSGFPLEPDPALTPGRARIETTNLFVEGGIDQAFAQLKAAVVGVVRRNAPADGP